MPGMTIVKTLLPCLCLSACALQSWDKPIEWQEDKIKHFSTTTIISGAAAHHQKEDYRDCDAAAQAVMFTMTIGAGKELHDKYIKKTLWDWNDMAWNLIGSTLGASLGAHCY